MLPWPNPALANLTSSIINREAKVLAAGMEEKENQEHSRMLCNDYTPWKKNCEAEEQLESNRDGIKIGEEM